MNTTNSSSNRAYPITVVFLLFSGLLLAILNFSSASKTRPTENSRSLAIATNAQSIPVVSRSHFQPPSTQRSNSPAPFSWGPVESSDYKAYIANLRKLSFPEELIRELIVADVDKLYASREEPLRWKIAPHDASLSERRKQPTVEHIEKLMQLRDLQIEKQSVLEQLLGVHVPREILRTPNSRNYEGYEYAINQLPPEKREAVQRLQEDEFLNDDMNQTRYRGYGSREEVKEYRALNDKHAAALQQILTTEEYEHYIMNSTPPGTEMARRVIGMEPTDEETVKMWRLTHELWKEEGGVYGRWHAEPRTSEQIATANEKFNTDLKTALGDERYLDYQMAVSDTGQQLRNFAARYDLPRETLAEAFALQTEIDKAVKVRSATPPPADELPPEILHVQKLQQQLQSTLGPDLYNSWNSGRKLSYDLQP